MTRFQVPEDEADTFRAQAQAALDAFAVRPGHLRGRVGRATDAPTAWVLVTEWESVGAYRRSLSAYDVKVEAAPLLARGQDEPSAYEVLVATDGGPATAARSRRAHDADVAAVGESSGPSRP